MVFKNLEEKLSVENFGIYSDIVQRIKEPFKSTLRYMLDIASVIEEIQLKDEYTMVGGYAVLTHIVDQFGDKIIPTWRGSQDIDMAGSYKVINALKSFYNIESDLPSPNIKDKRTLKIKEDENECKIDFILGDLPYKREEKRILGIPILVASPFDLIKSKASLAKEQLTHKVDVLKLLGVLEYRGFSINELVSGLDEQQREDLYNILENGKGITENKRMNFGPGNEYAQLLKKYLHKFIIHEKI